MEGGRDVMKVCELNVERAGELQQALRKDYDTMRGQNLKKCMWCVPCERVQKEGKRVVE